MYNYLKSLIDWFKRTNTTEKIIIPEKKYLCNIDLRLTYDNKLDIICYWPDLDNLDESTIDNLAEQYAKIIYLVDSGHLKKDILDTLYTAQKKNNPSDTFFVYQVIHHWVNFTETEEAMAQKHKPVVKPTEAFNRYTTKL